MLQQDSPCWTEFSLHFRNESNKDRLKTPWRPQNFAAESCDRLTAASHRFIVIWLMLVIPTRFHKPWSVWAFTVLLRMHHWHDMLSTRNRKDQTKLISFTILFWLRVPNRTDRLKMTEASTYCIHNIVHSLTGTAELTTKTLALAFEYFRSINLVTVTKLGASWQAVHQKKRSQLSLGLELWQSGLVRVGSENRWIFSLYFSAVQKDETGSFITR